VFFINLESNVSPAYIFYRESAYIVLIVEVSLL